MNIGILGAGMIGTTLARLWSAAGHVVMVSSRNPEDLRHVADKVHPTARAGHAVEAARFGEVVLLAVPFAAPMTFAQDVKDALAGKVLLDAGNPMAHRDGEVATQVTTEGKGSGVWTARQLPGARVVKAFNTVYFQTLAREAHSKRERLGIPLASDDTGALGVAAALVKDAGFEPVVVGELTQARLFDPGTPVWNSGFGVGAVRRELGL